MMRNVYFIKPVGMDGPIKIGCSAHVGKRLTALSAWSPFPLEIVCTIPGSFDLEQRIQANFSADHLHHEWFNATPELIRSVQRLLAGARVEDVFDLGALGAGKIARRANVICRKHHEYRREYMSLLMKLTHAAKRNGCLTIWPNTIGGVFDEWKTTKIRPNAADLELIENAIASPAAYLRRRNQIPDPNCQHFHSGFTSSENAA